MSDPLHYRVLRSFADLEQMRPAWIDLWSRDPRSTPFQRPEWLVPWWRSFGTGDLRAITVHDGPRLVALIPLYIYRDAERNERQLLLLGAGTSDYLDGIFDPECTPEIVLAGLERAAIDDTWDVAHLTQLREDSPLRHALEALPASSVERYRGEPTSRFAAVPMRDLPRKLRSAILYFRNAAVGQGALRLHTADATDCAALFETLVEQHTARWQSAGEAGVLADPQVLAWHREAIPQLQASGLLRLSALALDGRSIAVIYSLMDAPHRPNRTQYLYLNGHSLAHADLQPGTLLQALLAETALSEEVRTIDMLRGDEAYKQMWRSSAVPTFGFAWRPARFLDSSAQPLSQHLPQEVTR